MRVIRRGRALTVMVAATLCLAGCQWEGHGVVVPPGFKDLPPCLVREIPIEELSTVGEPGCDLTGSRLLFSGETLEYAVGPPPSQGGPPTLEIRSVGGAFSQGDGRGRELLITNWGVPGVSVAAVEDGRLLKSWVSSDAARDLLRQSLEIDNIDVATEGRRPTG